MEVIPRQVAYASAALTGFVRNSFRLETSGATSAGPSSIVTFTMPSSSTIDTKSLRIKFDVTTTMDAVNNVHAKLPADVNSLIQSVEVYVNGQCVEQACSEYNTLCRILKIVRSSRDRDGSVDALLSHGVIDTADAVDDVSVVLQDFKGFLGEASTRYINTNICGEMTIRITFAPTHVLAFKQTGVAIGGNFTNAASRAAAELLTYSVSNLHATVDTISLGSVYESMLMDRLAQEEYLPIVYKAYNTFSLHGITSGAHAIKFNLSSNSIDNIYAVFRNDNYQTAGIKTQLYTGASLTDTSCSNSLYFQSFNSTSTKTGTLRYHFTIGSVRHPQYDADILDAAANLSLVTDQVYQEGRGHMVTSLSHFNNGVCVVPLSLSMPGQGPNVKAGYSSMGANTTMSLDVRGQVIPTAVAASGRVAAISTFVVVESSQELRISQNRQCTIAY